MNNPAARVIFAWRDGSGSPGVCSLSVPDSTGVESVRAAAEAVAGALSALSGCSFQRYTIVYTTVVSDDRPAPGTDANSLLRLAFSTAGDGYAAVDVPGLRTELVGEDGTAVDATQPAVAALVAALLSGLWLDMLGRDLTELLASYREVQI